MSPKRQPHRTLPALALLAAFAALPACDNNAGSASTTPDLTDPASYAEGQAYTVRGEITQLPDPGPPPTEFKIHHEHIPDFIGKSGEVFVSSDGVRGMRSMVMAFPYRAPGVDLSEFTAGDKVEFEFLVRWETSPGGDRTPTWLIGSMTKLPPETVISYENKPQAQPEPKPEEEDSEP